MAAGVFSRLALSSRSPRILMYAMYTPVRANAISRHSSKIPSPGKGPYCELASGVPFLLPPAQMKSEENKHRLQHFHP